MKTDNKLFEYFESDDIDPKISLPRIKGLTEKKYQQFSTLKKVDKVKIDDLSEQFDDLREYRFTYKASRHERWWLLDSLGPFYDEQWIDDVLRMVKGGKEASVYLCKANVSTGASYLAAKVFRPRSLRNLRKDHLYREGRARLDSDGLEIVDERQYRAMKHKTDFGKSLMHISWIEHEYRSLQLLQYAGCDVPKPYASDHNAILMEYIGDDNCAAPTLNTVKVDFDEAKWLYGRIVYNLKIMLENERVHGDLSAYNILYWGGELSIIDFPQSINPYKNPNAYFIFQRDVTRICDYLNSRGLSIHPDNLAENLWTSYGYDTTPNIIMSGINEDDFNVETQE